MAADSCGRTARDDTVAFFGLARSGAVLLAAGIDGVYRVSAQSLEREPLPRFTDIGGIKVSFEILRIDTNPSQVPDRLPRNSLRVEVQLYDMGCEAVASVNR